MQTRFSKDEGLISFWTGVFIIILIIGIWAAFKIMPMYYKYWEIESFIHAQARVVQMKAGDPARSLESSRREIMKRISELEIPLESEDNLKLAFFGSDLQAHLEWEEVLDVDFGELVGFLGGDYDLYYQIHVFEFVVDTGPK